MDRRWCAWSGDGHGFAGCFALGICHKFMNTKVYLGDAVYAEFDGHGIVLTTEDGISATNTIVLEPEVWNGLVRYVAHLKSLTAPLQSQEANRMPENADTDPRNWLPPMSEGA